jgi:hypothetical protein
MYSPFFYIIGRRAEKAQLIYSVNLLSPQMGGALYSSSSEGQENSANFRLAREFSIRLNIGVTADKS